MDRRDAEPAPSGPREQAGDPVETVLQLSIDLYGPSLLAQPDKLRRQLEERCPGATFDISLLLMALEEEIPQTLLRVKSPDEVRELLPRLEAQLTDRRDLVPFASAWAVATWANVLRMDSVPLASSGPLPSVPLGDTPPQFVEGELPIDAAMPDTKPAIEPAPPAPGGVASHREHAPANEPFVDPEATAAFAGSSEPAAAIAAATEPVASVSTSRSTPTTDDGLPGWASDDEAIDEETYPVAVRNFSHWYGIGGVLLAVLVFAVSIRYASGPSDSAVAPSTSGPQVTTAPSPVASAAPSIAAPAATTTGPVTTPTTAPPIAPPTSAAMPAIPRIAAVTSDDPLPGDGKEHPVFVSVEAMRDDVRWIETQFISGDGTWEARPRVIDVPADAVHDGRIAAGTIGLRTMQPATATFQYVLTMADGTHSAPFVKQFTFAPVAARPPTIVEVGSPSNVVAGKPAILTIAYRDGDGEVATVERKPVPGDGAATDGPAVVTAVASLAKSKAGTLRYPVETSGNASRNAYDVTLIDRDGLRSESKRVVVEAAVPVADKPATMAAAITAPVSSLAAGPSSGSAASVASVASVASAASASSAAAVKSTAPSKTASTASTAMTPAATGPCSREACGSVVSVREAATDGSPAKRRVGNDEVIVRMDDRSIKSFTIPGKWKTGVRVRLVGGKLVAIEGRDAGRDVTRDPPREPPAPPRRLLPESVPIVDQ